MTDTISPSERLAVAGYDEVLRIDLGDTVAFLALHAVLGGHAFGGVRFRRYPDEKAARDDALALAGAMSRKFALTGIVGGGGKTVVMLPEGEFDRAGCVARLGRFIESLGGRYRCGPDYGYTAADDVVLRENTQYVACEGMAPFTAATVRAGLLAAAPDARKVVVQGLGSVGLPLARTLRDEDGLDVVASEPTGTHDFRAVEADAVYDEPADVFSPNAFGGVLDEDTIARLRVRVVCGGANNPFATAQDMLRLHARGIVCVPDMLSNSGAAIVGASRELGEDALIDERLAAVGPTVSAVLSEAAARDVPPHVVAVERADRRLAELRAAESGA